MTDKPLPPAPPGWLSMNMNARVRVKLTPKGYQVYERYMADLGCGLPLVPKVDGDGWYEDQMWSIANIFGSSMYNGCEVPFETEIQVYAGPPW